MLLGAVEELGLQLELDRGVGVGRREQGALGQLRRPPAVRGDAIAYPTLASSGPLS